MKAFLISMLVTLACAASAAAQSQTGTVVLSVTKSSVTWADVYRKTCSPPSAIKAAAKRQCIELPDCWKASVAINLESEWAEKGTKLPEAVLAPAEAWFKEIDRRFDAGISTGVRANSE